MPPERLTHYNRRMPQHRPAEAVSELHHIPELDGVRGIAVLGVVVMHFYSLPLVAKAHPVLRAPSRSLEAGWISDGWHPIASRHQSLQFMLATLLGGTLISYGLAWLSWHLLEVRVLSLKRHFPYRVNVPSALPAAPVPSL